jgi:uncharacterized protein
MLKQTFLSLSLLATFAAQAQTPAPASSPAKKEIIARILKVQQPAVEALARGLVERPALEIMNSAMQVIAARVPKEKQEAVAKEVQADAQKFVENAGAVVGRRAVALAPTTIGAVLDEKFTEDELKQIAAALENPALIKYQATIPAMQQALGEKLVADTRSQVEPKVHALEDQVGKRIGVSPQEAAPAPAKPASKKK